MSRSTAVIAFAALLVGLALGLLLPRQGRQEPAMLQPEAGSVLLNLTVVHNPHRSSPVAMEGQDKEGGYRGRVEFKDEARGRAAVAKAMNLLLTEPGD